MPSYLDLALLLIIMVSALLSMVRGFTREVLAIASWGAATAAAYFLYPHVLPFVTPYIAKETVAKIASAAAVFFVTLVVVSIITVKLSEAILDSKVGALDRSLGFLFGAARGFFLGVVAFLFFNWLVPTNKQPEWVANAKSKPLLQATGQEIFALLPEDLDSTLLKGFKRDKASPNEDIPAESESTPAEKRTDARTPPPSTPAPSAADKQKLDELAGKSGGQTPAKAPDKKP